MELPWRDDCRSYSGLRTLRAFFGFLDGEQSARALNHPV